MPAKRIPVKTWADLSKMISGMTPSELKQDITVFDPDYDQFYIVPVAYVSDADNDELDPGHYYLYIDK